MLPEIAPEIAPPLLSVPETSPVGAAALVEQAAVMVVVLVTVVGAGATADSDTSPVGVPRFLSGTKPGGGRS
jgi:hypothetical protein